MSRSVLALAAALLLAAPAAAQDAPPPPPDAIAYRLVVDAPDPPRAALLEGLDLARWQSDTGMTLDLLERLAREALEQAREIAAVHGYYEATARVAIDRDQRPVVVRLTVDPGLPSRVRSVAVDVTGPAARDVPLGTDAIRDAREGWTLELGEVFRQADWIEAKARALRALQRAPYPAARIVASEARVDPGQQSAALSVTIDSGPAYRFGTLAVGGLRRYAPEVVRHFSTIEPGEPYTEAALDQLVRRLSSTGYFSSVQAAIDPSTADPAAATVDVHVIEGPTHRFEGGLSYSTDTGYGARATYTNVNLDGRALQMRLEARAEAREQLLGARFTWPPTAARWIHVLTAGAKRTDIQNTVETTAGIDVERRAVDERDTPSLRAAFYADRQAPQGADPVSSHATFVEAGYVRRRVDDLLSPTRGWMVDARVGAGIPGLSSRGFGRAFVQGAAWWPLDRRTALAFRGELGAVLASARDGIPSVYLFRTGGDTTVRGYAYESLGVRSGDAVVGGRYLAVASAEAIRWIGEAWGVAVFADLGDAADRFGDLDPALGVGVGARVRTPIGPFRLDAAWGERTGKLRLHFSVGMTF